MYTWSRTALLGSEAEGNETREGDGEAVRESGDAREGDEEREGDETREGDDAQEGDEQQEVVTARSPGLEVQRPGDRRALPAVACS